MNRGGVINSIQKHLRKVFVGEPTGHDFWHSLRVWKMAKKITKKEGGDLFVIELAALLHDIADWKFNNGNIKMGSKKGKDLLEKLGVEQVVIKKVGYIIDNVSFKGAGVKNKIKTKEGMIVQDSDRLDVIGAIGIARVFAFGGFAGREIHNPNTKPKIHKSFLAYKKNKSTSINHFHEKVLLLEKRLNTKTAKNIAKHRQKFLEVYLKQFFKEWKGRA